MRKYGGDSGGRRGEPVDRILYESPIGPSTHSVRVKAVFEHFLLRHSHGGDALGFVFLLPLAHPPLRDDARSRRPILGVGLPAPLKNCTKFMTLAIRPVLFCRVSSVSLADSLVHNDLRTISRRSRKRIQPL